LNAGDTQAAVADDAGAEEWSDLGGGHVGRERKGEVCADRCVLGITAVDGVSGKDRAVAEVLHRMAAIPAIAIDAADPGDAGAGAEREFWSGSVDDFADDLVAGDDAGMDWRKVAFNDVQVSAADSAGEDFEENMAGLRLEAGNFLYREPLAGVVGRVEDGGAHGIHDDRVTPASCLGGASGVGLLA
jgi:hypothetical protein